jgi:hypothetical protein
LPDTGNGIPFNANLNLFIKNCLSVFFDNVRLGGQPFFIILWNFLSIVAERLENWFRAPA